MQPMNIHEMYYKKVKITYYTKGANGYKHSTVHLQIDRALEQRDVIVIVQRYLLTCAATNQITDASLFSLSPISGAFSGVVSCPASRPAEGLCRRQY